MCLPSLASKTPVRKELLNQCSIAGTGFAVQGTPHVGALPTALNATNLAGTMAVGKFVVELER
jgi:hypothetical protein